MLTKYDIGFADGYAAAIADATNVAKDYECSIGRGTEICNCDIEIADAIKALLSRRSR